jgi:hypothetical protein
VQSIRHKAISIACSDMEDAPAVERLRTIAAGNMDAARNALENLSRARDEYVADRAYRLLVSVVDGVSVPAPPAELRELFDREAELGRLPIKRAIATLVELEPRLAIVTSMSTSEVERSHRLEIKSITGPGSDNPDPLIQSNLALSVVSHYLELDTDDADPADADASYFGARRKRVVRRLV